ncbi:hypothetical protein KXX26_003203, partial [Aspergillus fumigatus]
PRQNLNKNKGQNDGASTAAHAQPQEPTPSPEALAQKIEYFCISIPTAEVTTLLHSLFPPSTPPEKARLYHHLVNSRRVQPTFHVTLIHRASKTERVDIWDRYANQYIAKMKEQSQAQAHTASPVLTPTLAPARVRLERLIWDDRIMAFVARIMPPGDREQPDWPCANPIPHVTVGTASAEVKPKESNDLLRRWLEVGSGGDAGIWEAEIPGVKVVQGSVGMVMSRGKLLK